MPHRPPLGFPAAEDAQRRLVSLLRSENGQLRAVIEKGNALADATEIKTHGGRIVLACRICAPQLKRPPFAHERNCPVSVFRNAVLRAP